MFISNLNLIFYYAELIYSKNPLFQKDVFVMPSKERDFHENG